MSWRQRVQQSIFSHHKRQTWRSDSTEWHFLTDIWLNFNNPFPHWSGATICQMLEGMDQGGLPMVRRWFWVHVEPCHQPDLCDVFILYQARWCFHCGTFHHQGWREMEVSQWRCCRNRGSSQNEVWLAGFDSFKVFLWSVDGYSDTPRNWVTSCCSSSGS